MKNLLTFLSAKADIHNIFTGRENIFGGDGGERLLGTDEDDFIHGGGGDDELFGRDGVDSLSGGPGDDRLLGGNHPDVLRGGTGDDRLSGGAGGDLLQGGDGNDTLNGGPGEDRLVGGRGRDIFGFTPGDSSLGNGDVISDFSPADDDFIGLLGFSSDKFNLTITGLIDATGSGLYGPSDSFTYGDGIRDDRILTLPDGGKVILLDVADVPLSAIRIPVGYTITEVAADAGGAGDDDLAADGRANVLIGGAGNDWLRGYGGNDRLYGGADEDTLYGGAGNDELDGGGGPDILHGGAGADTFIFNPGDSTHFIRGGSNIQALDIVRDFTPSEGDKIVLNGYDSRSLTFELFDPVDEPVVTELPRGQVNIQGPRGVMIHLPDGNRLFLVDVVNPPTIDGYTLAPPEQMGGAGNDRLDGGASDDQLSGGAGDDRLAGKAGNDELDGGPGDDTMYGGTGDDGLYGGPGADRLYGGPGEDHLSGGTGGDRLSGGLDKDRLYGGDGEDESYGGAGNDYVDGGAGNDRLYGGPGNDLIVGDEGDDLLSGGPGWDRHWGGDGIAPTGGGADTFRFVPGHSLDGDIIFKFTITGPERDVIDLRAFNLSSAATLTALEAQGLIVSDLYAGHDDGVANDRQIFLPDGGYIGLANLFSDAELTLDNFIL